jgi:hypothetical protein
VTPQLIQWFAEFKKSHPSSDKMEIVYISSDHDQDAFTEYFKEMTGFHALPFAERRIKVCAVRLTYFTALTH